MILYNIEKIIKWGIFMKFNILVVEDEKDIAYAIKAYLDNQRYKVFIANYNVICKIRRNR